MSFSSAILLMALMSCVGLLGCAKRDHPANEPIHINLKGGGECLTKFSVRLSEFVDGKLDSDQISSFWNCLSSTISEFERMSAGDPNGGDNYSPRALRRFIQKYFLSSQLSDGLLSAFMEVKRVFLSGSTETVTRMELRRLDDLFQQLKVMSLDVQPHVNVIFRNRTHASDQELRESTQALQTAVMRLATWLSEQKQTYRFSQMSELMKELKRFLVANGSSGDSFDSVMKAAVLLPETKAILIAGDKGSIQGEEWLTVGRAVSSALALYISVCHGFDTNFDSGLTRETLPETMAAFAATLAQSAARHDGNTIPLAEFSMLIGKLGRVGWLPAGMKAQSVEEILLWFLRRPLGDGTTKSPGLTLAQAKILEQRLVDWRMLSAGLTTGSALERKFESVLTASEPMSWDGKGRMNFPRAAPASWSGADRARMVWSFVLLNWLKDAYAGEEPMFLGDEQLDAIAGEVLPLLQSFGWFKSTKPTIGRRILREADLFTVVSNGNGKFDLAEAVRYVGFVVSSWRTSWEWLHLAEQKCGGKKASCVRDLFVNSPAEVVPNMQRLQQVFLSWRPQRLKAYMEKSEITALDSVQEGEFATGDLLMVVQLFQYAEAFFQRFDPAVTEVIHLDQAQKAYPVYAATLEKMLNGAVSGDELNAFFTFLFRYGDTPFTMFGGQVAYNHWRWHRDQWQVDADRDILMSILSQLAKL